jgi:diguanylate cyclase (GGDEF)-like protein
MDNSKKAQEFAKASIEAIRSIASEKKEMNAENLAKEFLKNKSVFKEVFDLAEPVKKESGKSKAFLDLEEKYEKLENQKNSFFRDYEELSEKRQKEKDFFNRALLFFADLSKGASDDSGKKELERFRNALKKGMGPDVLEAEFYKIKNNILKNELDAADKQEEKKNFFKKVKFAQAFSSGTREVKTEYIELLRDTYKEIIEKLNLALGENQVAELSDIAAGLNKISTPDDFFMVRSKLLDILNAYLQSVDDDREEAAEFIKEIGKRLLEVEDQLLSSYADDTGHYKESNTNFTTLLEDHLDDLNKNVSISKTIEEVKSAVVSKLNTIKIVIHRKNAEDKKYQEEVEEKFARMQQRFSVLRREMEKADLRTKKMEKDLLLDPLTGSYNRRAYDKKVKEEVERYFRYGTKFSMILFDIDHFKNINDKYGHDIGDKCLHEIIKKVTPLLRESDFLARYGGEEFAVLLPETDVDGTANAAEKIRKTVEEISFVYKKETIKITVSLGVCEIGKDDTGYDSLFSRLDKAMYEAKNKGRNKVEISR